MGGARFRHYLLQQRVQLSHVAVDIVVGIHHLVHGAVDFLRVRYSHLGIAHDVTQAWPIEENPGTILDERAGVAERAVSRRVTFQRFARDLGDRLISDRRLPRLAPQRRPLRNA